MVKPYPYKVVSARLARNIGSNPVRGTILKEPND